MMMMMMMMMMIIIIIICEYSVLLNRNHVYEKIFSINSRA